MFYLVHINIVKNKNFTSLNFVIIFSAITYFNSQSVSYLYD